MGVVMLFDIADKFGQADDPDYESGCWSSTGTDLGGAPAVFRARGRAGACAAGCAATSRYLRGGLIA